jgi:hypothetical protein
MKPADTHHRFRGRMTLVGPGLADVELTEEAGTVTSTLAFLDESTFREEGTIDFGGGDRVHFRSSAAGELVPGGSGERHGEATLEIYGGAGRFAGARGSITSSFVVSDGGAVVDERVFHVVIDRKET